LIRGRGKVLKRGASAPLKHPLSQPLCQKKAISLVGIAPLKLLYHYLKVRRVKERLRLSYITNSPSPLKERGIKGVRLIKNLITNSLLIFRLG